MVTAGAISRAKLQSNHHHQQTNIQHFTDQMPFLSPNQQCQSTEGKISHSMDLLTPSSPGGLPTLSVTTNSSWLPWGRVAMPLISPLMPVPTDYHSEYCNNCRQCCLLCDVQKALISEKNLKIQRQAEDEKRTRKHHNVQLVGGRNLSCSVGILKWW